MNTEERSILLNVAETAEYEFRLDKNTGTNEKI